MTGAGEVALLDVYTKQVEMNIKIETLLAQLPDHESRIRALEKWRYSIPVSALTAVASMILAVLSLVHGL